MGRKIAVAGAGIYGATAAIRLAEHGHRVTLFDPLGVLRAASAINQCRVHAGYHYPRSPETMAEIAEASEEFLREFAPAILRNTQHYYAIPKEGSRTSAAEYETIMQQQGLPLQSCRPEWMDFGFIGHCYAVEEHLYDSDILRDLIENRIKSSGIALKIAAFTPAMQEDFDWTVWATYGLSPDRRMFSAAKVQVAEKVLIQLPAALQRLSIVIVDGPFTAFDPYGHSTTSLFGSAKHTNHWSTTDPREPVPARFAALLNGPGFAPVPFTRFEEMRADSSPAIPGAKHAQYLGSRFTLRVVENSPEQDRRTLYLIKNGPREIYLFSGKVVSAIKAARLVCEAVADEQ